MQASPELAFLLWYDFANKISKYTNINKLYHLAS